MTFENYFEKIRNAETIVRSGKIEKIVGMVIESSGPNADIGTVCRIYNPKKNLCIRAEVVGFRENRVLLMPFENSMA